MINGYSETGEPMAARLDWPQAASDSARMGNTISDRKATP